MERRIVFTEPGKVELESMELPAVGPGEVRLRTLRSLISAGTEGIVLHHRFAPDTHWDRWVKYPFLPGYCAVSEVAEVGAEVTRFQVGDRVASRSGHASVAVLSEANVMRLPEALRTEDAAWFGLAKIAYVGYLAADLRPDDRVLVIGAGPIGQMMLRWAVTSGARVGALDPIADRLRFSEMGGAAFTLDIPAAGAIDAVRAGFEGELPRVVVDTTGHAAVFSAALSLAENHGRVVLLGDPGAPSEQRLTSDVITRGLTIVGAHDNHLPNVPASYEPFFARADRFALPGLTTNVFTPEDAAAAYALATTTVDAMGVQFDWT